MRWELTGNGGMNPAVDFMEAVDNQPLILTASNSEAFRIAAAGAMCSRVGLGTTNPLFRLNVAALGAVGGEDSIHHMTYSGAAGPREARSGRHVPSWSQNQSIPPPAMQKCRSSPWVEGL